ncbi:MAG: tRNA preQ1(34) S-adenosylmethionine ribosyltransferase-isomerase QueA [Minisyncoccia bacterium]
MERKDNLFKQYDYFLPKKNLALTPAIPRDSSKLFVYDTQNDKIYFDRFYHLDKYLPQNSFLVLNNTKVMPARVTLKKETGGKVTVLFFINELSQKQDFQIVRGLVDRKVTLGEKLYFAKNNFVKVFRQKESIFYFKLNFSKEKFFSLILKYGSPPVPLYLRKTPLNKEQLLKKYQTIFAKKQGSIAAPTASLHFTNRVFKRLEEKGIKKYFVTLHVGLGTFAPLSRENLKTKKLHEEYYEVDKNIWEKILKEKENGKKLVAVGTTVVRTVESVKISFNQLKSEKTKNKIIEKTDLFIFPPFNFQMVDNLLTNFHLPNSSLMMLVEAFLQFKKAKKHLVDLYNIAIKNEFRFYSFGDSMVIK